MNIEGRGPFFRFFLCDIQSIGWFFNFCNTGVIGWLLGAEGICGQRKPSWQRGQQHDRWYCVPGWQAGLSTYTFTYLSYSVWFATEYIGYLLPLTYISSPDLLTCTHIFVMRKGLINIYTYLHRLQLGQKWTHFDIMIQSVQCHIMEGVCPILGKKTRGIKSFLFLEASDTNIC